MWSTQCPGRFIPGKENQSPLYRRLGMPHGRSGRVRIILPPPGFDPRIIHPIVNRYTDWSIPAPVHYSVLLSIAKIIYRGADKSVAQPGRKQTNISVRIVWISFSTLPCRKKKNLMTARVLMVLKSCSSLTCFWACFLPGWAKDLLINKFTANSNQYLTY